MQLGHTVASRSISDWQNGHSFCGRPAKFNSRKSGPKIMACGNEKRTMNNARSGLADFVSSKNEPISPSPLHIKIIGTKFMFGQLLAGESFSFSKPQWGLVFRNQQDIADVDRAAMKDYLIQIRPISLLRSTACLSGYRPTIRRSPCMSSISGIERILSTVTIKSY